MSVYVVAQLTIKDRDKLMAYREKAGSAIAKHGGAMVCGGPKPEALEAAGEVPDMMALINFPDAAAARAWRDDPELAETHALRNAAGASTILIVPST